MAVVLDSLPLWDPSMHTPWLQARLRQILAVRLPEADPSELQLITFQEVADGIAACCRWAMSTLVVVKKIAILLGTGRTKSSTWLANIAWDHLTPPDVVCFDCVSEMCEALRAGVRQFVYFDDAAYWGLQVMQMLYRLTTAIASTNAQGVTVLVCIPFTTSGSLVKMAEVTHPELSVLICPRRQKIPKCSGVFASQCARTGSFLRFPEYKVPDSLGIPCNVSHALQRAMPHAMPYKRPKEYLHFWPRTSRRLFSVQAPRTPYQMMLDRDEENLKRAKAEFYRSWRQLRSSRHLKVE